MTDGDRSSASGPAAHEPQPVVLVNLLLALNAARRQMSLYGSDHPNTAQSAQALAGNFKEFGEAFGRSTLVLTQTAALVNEHGYAASSESQELFQRLRARGVMAITIVSPPPPEQIVAFVGFLNDDPEEMRRQGGASASLRKRGVSLIVATDAVYSSGDESDSAEENAQKSALDPKDMDRALGAAVDWLLRQDEEEDDAPRLPIAEILSHPDEAAKLIREAVTKLHASRRQDTHGEIASEVVHDLKDLASDDPDGWDSATPQIRKAMSKLPKDMRPEVAGFTGADECEKDESRVRSSHLADIFEIEAQVAEVLDEASAVDADRAIPAPDAFSSLFGASPCGLLTAWRKELQPDVVMGSSGRTLETLMVQETSGSEHERIARALAGLLPRAVEMKDHASARAIADGLMREIRGNDPSDWRAVNARSALRSLDKAILRQAAEAWAALDDPDAGRSACHMVELLPELALQMIDVLGRRDLGDLDRAVARGIAGCGAAAVGPLGGLLTEGREGAKDLALDALIRMNTTAAIREIGQALREADEAFTIRALAKLASVKHPDVVDASVDLLSSSSAGVRRAALAALGELAVPTTVPAIVQAASRRGLGHDDVAEKIAALEALGRIDCDESREFLERMAARRPLIGKKRYEAVRQTAERVLDEMGPRPVPETKAA